MKTTLLLLFACISFNLYSQTAYQHWKWAKAFGGSGNDTVVSMKIKNGFLYVAGTYGSPQINWEGTTLNNNGGSDIFLAKMDTSGNTIWVKSFGGAGLDSVNQMEINNSGTAVLKCNSTGTAVIAGSFNLTTPANFYFTVNTNGTVTSAAVLPAAVTNYHDIDIDVLNGVYVAARYLDTFRFGGVLVDTIFRSGAYPIGIVCKTGASILKYNENAIPVWMKTLQNIRTVPYPWQAADSGLIQVRMEANPADTSLEFLVVENGVTKIDSIEINHTGFSPVGASSATYVKLFSTGISTIIDPNLFGSSTLSSSFHCFEIAMNGYSYTVYRPGSLNGLREVLARRRNNIATAFFSAAGDPYYGFLPFVISSVEPNEAGDFITVNVPAYRNEGDVAIYDTALQKIKSTVIPEKSQFPLSIKNMADTGSLYFASSFKPDSVFVNSGLPTVSPIVLPNNGTSNILIGQYSILGLNPPVLSAYSDRVKICSDSIQLGLTLTTVGSGNLTYQWQPANIFSNAGILNPRVFITQDSVLAQLSITDGNSAAVIKSILFYRGFNQDLRLVTTSSPVCQHDTITVSLAGTYFEPVYISTPPTPPGISRPFNSPGSVVKYTAAQSHSLVLQSVIPNDHCYGPAVSIVVRPSYYREFSEQICVGGSYTFPDGFTVNNVQTSIFHYSNFTTVNGCDSIIRGQVVPRTTIIKVTSDTICYGNSYLFPDGTLVQNIIADTFQISTLPGNDGACDTALTTYVRIRTTLVTTVNSSICSGSSFTFPDGTVQQNIVTDMTQTSHFTTTTDCDSSVVTHLHIYPVSASSQASSICSGGSFTFPDGFVSQNIIADFSHVSHLTNVYGCDSSVSINIHVYPVYSITDNPGICPGGNFSFPDGTAQQNIVSDITYVSHLSTIHGCDSSITTNLHIYPVSNVTINDTVCKGTTVLFPDGTTQAIILPTNYVSHFSNVFGCDSTITSMIAVTTTDTSVIKSGLDLSSNNNGATYQWIDCTSQTAIASATAQLYRATAVGSYAVAVTKDGCTDTSTCYPITNIDILGGRIGQISLFPVPARNSLTILFQSETATELFATLISPSGAVDRQNRFTIIPGVNTINYSLDNLTPGLYSLRFYKADTQEVIIKKFIKL